MAEQPAAEQNQQTNATHPQEKTNPSAGSNDVRIVGTIILVIGAAFLFIGLISEGGGFLCAFPLILVGGIIRERSNAKLRGRKPGFLRAWVLPLVVATGAVAVFAKIPRGTAASFFEGATPAAAPVPAAMPPPVTGATPTAAPVATPPPTPVPETNQVAAVEVAELPKPVEPKFTLSATRLVSEYETNPKVAENKYEGERVRVKGNVADFTGFSKDAITFIGTGHDLTAEFADDSMLRLRKGMAVVLLCEEVYFGTSIRLYKCVAELPPPPHESQGNVAAALADPAAWANKLWRCTGDQTGINSSFEVGPKGTKVSFSQRTPAGPEQGTMKINRIKYGSSKKELTDAYGAKTGETKETQYVDVVTSSETIGEFRLIRDTTGSTMYMMSDGRLMGSNAVAHCE